jgi:hypothetical protein
VFLRTEMHDIAGAPRATDPGHPAGSYLTEAAGSWTCSLRRSSSAAMDAKPPFRKNAPVPEKFSGDVLSVVGATQIALKPRESMMTAASDASEESRPQPTLSLYSSSR